MKQLTVTAPINDLSYGLVSKSLVRELSKLASVGLNVIGQTTEGCPAINRCIETFLESKLDRTVTSLRVFHQFDLVNHPGSGKHIGFPFFELDTFDRLEKCHLRNQDLVIVASKWAQSIVNNNVDVPCEVVPLGVDTSTFFPSKQDSNKCIFLNIGKLEYRKGIDVLLQAASKVFKDKEDVALWMMASNPFLSDESMKKNIHMFRRELGNKVSFLPRVKTQQEVASIINRCNFGVFPYRAEGWNLPLMECMACGLPVIATNYSAPTEYINENNCFTIEVDGLEAANDGVFFDGSKGNWGKLTHKYINKLCEHMEECYLLWKKNKELINNECVETAQRYSWSNSAKEILKYVE